MSNESLRPASRRRSDSLIRGARPRSIVRFLLILFGVVMIVDAIVGDQGFLAMRRATQEYNELETNLSRIQAENARRLDEVERLRNDLGAIEDAARRDLGLIRRGERVFILKDLPSPARQ